ncbi:hypothetical protein SAMN05421840_11066 [Shewanella morhuae]|nr:hypothetical protein SAMN05421840_11066 [Shewanella morhuae]
MAVTLKKLLCPEKKNSRSRSHWALKKPDKLEQISIIDAS